MNLTVDTSSQAARELIERVFGEAGPFTESYPLVFEEAHATGTHKGPWRNQPATERRVEFGVVIFFPWDPTRKKFLGEALRRSGIDARVD